MTPTLGSRSAVRGGPDQSTGHATGPHAAGIRPSAAAVHDRGPRRGPDIRPGRARPLLAADDDHPGPQARRRGPGIAHRRPRRCAGGADPHHARKASTPCGKCVSTAARPSTRIWSGSMPPTGKRSATPCVCCADFSRMRPPPPPPSNNRKGVAAPYVAPTQGCLGRCLRVRRRVHGDRSRRPAFSSRSPTT